jgi:hypothetical protein
MSEPCAMCVLILQLGKLSAFEKKAYATHLRLKHHLPAYHIER